MMKLSRGAMAAIAAAIAIPATVAIAHNYERGGWHRMDPETRSRLQEGQIAGAKAALKLNGEQEKLWAAVETEIRGAYAARAAHMAEREKMREERRKARDEAKDATGDAKIDMSERIEKMSQRMGERAERMKAFAAAFKPFYASLSDEQKQVLRPVMRDLMPGGRGHGKKRWAHGGGRHGWDDDHGWHHKGKWREGRHGGGEDRGGDGPRGDGRGPATEQFMPEIDEEGPAAPGDQL